MSDPSASQSSQNLSWILVECPACQSPMKIRRERVGGSEAFLCPSCKAPVAIEFTLELEDEDTQPPTASSKTNRAAPMPAGIGPRQEIKEDVAQGVNGKTLRPSPLPAPRPDVQPQFRSPSFRATLPEKTAERNTSGKAAAVDLTSKVVLSDANPGSVGRLVTAGAHQLDDEFKAKLRAITEIKRVKRRKKTSEAKEGLADWNSEFENIPEAEMKGDEWGHTEVTEEQLGVTNFVTNVDLVGGQQVERVRRVHRKKRLKGLAKLYDRLGKFGIAGICVLLVALTCFSAYFAVKSYTNKVKEGKADVTQLSDSHKRSRISRAQTLTEDDVTAALNAITRFYAAGTVTERAALVRDQARVRPLMEAWHATRPFGPQTVHGLVGNETGETLVRTAFVENAGIMIYLGVEVGDARAVRYVAVEEVPGLDGKAPSYLVDWEVTSQYQPMEIDEYQIKQPKEPMDFRVRLKPGDYYNHEYADANQWACYKLTYPGDNDFQMLGYVRKGTQLASELERQLGIEPNVILRLKYGPRATSREQVEIEKLVHPSWFYPRSEAIPGLN